MGHPGVFAAPDKKQHARMDHSRSSRVCSAAGHSWNYYIISKNIN